MKAETSAKLKLNDEEVSLIHGALQYALENYKGFSPNEFDFLERLCDTIYGNKVTIKATIANENKFVIAGY